MVNVSSKDILDLDKLLAYDEKQGKMIEVLFGKNI